MEQKYVLGIMALALVSILGASIVSAHGFGFGMMDHELSDEEREEMKAQMDAIQEAIANGDYETWAELMNERIAKMQEEINEENFNSIVEQHNDIEQVHSLREELRNAVEDGDSELAEELRTQLQELMPGNGMKVGWGMHHKMGPPEEIPFN